MNKRIAREEAKDERYSKLLEKYLDLKLNQILKGRMNDTEEMIYAMDKGENKKEIIQSLMSSQVATYGELKELEEFIINDEGSN